MQEQKFVEQIADIKENFPQWYTDVILKTELVDYGPVKGTMVIRPYGYAVWENIQRELDRRFKATGHVNAYFPLLIPESFLKREAEHVEGFAPECAMVTTIGDEPLAERLVIRPTSETVICEMYSKWIQSYRDLPVLYNQWANVVRWEKTTRPFLRTSEFLWQEGHTAHATAEEAQEETIRMLGVYEEFCRNVLAMPVICGRKSEKEKFAGAVATYSIEAMMLDGKSLQAGTTHFLGENFARAFDIKFSDKDGVHKYVNQSSWGVSTRLIGALIMAHGDQRGLVLPPEVAPIQIIMIPIASHKPGVTEACNALSAKLSAKFRVKVDDRDASTGWKLNEWEMRGVPLRIEIGPRDLERGEATVFRRDTLEKFTAPIADLPRLAAKLLKDIQRNMYKKAEKHLRGHIVKVKNLNALVAAVNSGNFAFGTWCGARDCEAALKEKHQISTRNMPLDQKPCNGRCAVCGKPADEHARTIYFGKAY